MSSMRLTKDKDSQLSLDSRKEFGGDWMFTIPQLMEKYNITRTTLYKRVGRRGRKPVSFSILRWEAIQGFDKMKTREDRALIAEKSKVTCTCGAASTKEGAVL